MQQYIPQSSALIAHTLLAVAALLLAACASDPVTSNLDPNADLEKYQTYAFLADLATDRDENYGSLETTYLKNAVARELQARGMTEDKTNPDILFNFAIQTQEKVQSRPTGAYGGVGYDPFYDDYYYGGWGTTHTTRIDQYTEGKLIVDAIDPDEKKLIWQGTTKGRLTTKALQNLEQTLDEAVAEIFAKFPSDLSQAEAPK